MAYPIIAEELIKQLDLLPGTTKKVLDFAKALTITAHKVIPFGLY